MLLKFSNVESNHLENSATSSVIMAVTINGRKGITMSGRIVAVCTILGVVIGVAGLYLPYRNEINDTLYQKKFLTGKWSNDATLIMNSKDLGMHKQHPPVVIQMIVDDDGSIDGEIISEGLCDGMPLTWYITLNSERPSVINFVFARKFYIRQQVDGAIDKGPIVATLKLVKEDRKHNSITFDVVDDPAGMMPKQLTVAKNLPMFEENYNFLQYYCAKSTKAFLNNKM